MEYRKKQPKNPAKSIKHWLVLASCCGIIASSIGLGINTLGVFFTPVADSLGVYRGTFAMQSTISTFAMAITSLFIPRMLERIRMKTMIRIGVVMASLGTIAMAFTTRIWVFNILGAMRGFGTGFFAMVPLTIIVNNWFEKKNGLAVSIGFCFSGVAGAVFSPIFTYFIETIGWEQAFIIMGILIAILCIPAMFYPFSMNPRDDGYLPYGYEEKKVKGKNGLEAESKIRREISWKETTFISVIILAVLHTSILGLSQHIPGYAESIFLGSQVGAWMLSALMIGNVTFKLVMGALSDIVGVVKSTIVIILINSLAIIILLTLRNIGMLIFGSWLLGSYFCIPAVGLPLLTNHFFGKNQTMYVYPIFSFAAGTGRSLSTTLVGYVYDFLGGYRAAFLIALVFHAVNISLILISERNKQPQ